MKKMFVYSDGRLIKMDGRLLEKLSPGVLKAPGVFETILVKNGRVLFLKEHWLRLLKGVKFFKFKRHYSQGYCRRCIDNVLRVNKLKDARVRVSVWKENSSEKLLIVCSAYKNFSLQKYCKGFKAVVMDQPMPAIKNPKIKSLNYQFFRKAFLFAQKQVCDEAILLNSKKQVVEGSRTNIFAVKSRVIFTPSLSSGCLQGITRGVVIKLARKIGFLVKEKNFSLNFLAQADEIFLTNSLIGVMPLLRIKKTGISLGDNSVTCKLMNFYRRLTEAPS